MKRWAAFAVFALGVACSSPAEPAQPPEPDPPEGENPPPQPPPQTLRILPLGNSITQADGSQLSYRYALWTRLVDAGADVDFVGSTNEHFGGPRMYPVHSGETFDPDHEGHWGWRADEILSGRGAGGLSDWLGDYDADVVLMHLGTNDAFAFEDTGTTLTELRQIVATLRSDNPDVIVLWALLIPTTDGSVNPIIDALNAQVPALVQELDTGASPVRVVDLNQGFDATLWTYDGVHPNLTGEAWMADRWLAGMQEFLP